MKIWVPLLVIATFSACAPKQYAVQQNAAPRSSVSEASAISRGKPATYRPPVTIESAPRLDIATYQDLYTRVIQPLQTGPWRYVIEGITLSANADQLAEWTLVLVLDTGATVKVEEIGVWDERAGSHFTIGYRRTLSALAEARSQDPSLDRYLRHWGRKPARTTATATPAAATPESTSARLGD